jgi:calcineurin-like phosphoesterase family protein
MDDEVWILGDVSWHNVTKTIEIFKRLNGIKKLCIGNHDKQYLKNKDFRDLFAEICHYKELEIGKDFIVLSHYPIPCFNRHYYGAYHLYGHVHTSFEWNMMNQVAYEMEALYDKPCHMYNVGCMIPDYNYAPQTLEEILDIWNTRKEK